MKLFNVSYMQGNYDGSYLTVGDDNDTVDTIREKEMKSTRWADQTAPENLQVIEITEIDGYAISLLFKSDITQYNYELKSKKVQDWVGCYIAEITPAIKNIDGVYMSNRKNSDIPLVTNKFDVITVEDWNKWYSLYYLTRNDDAEAILVAFTFGDIINGMDHYYYPESVVRFAKVNNLKIDIISYIAICKMYMEDAGCMADEIPDDVLPTLEDLDLVLTNASGICESFYLHHKYDACCYRNYVKKNI